MRTGANSISYCAGHWIVSVAKVWCRQSATFSGLPPPASGDKFEIGFDRGEVGSRPIGLAQRKDVLVRHMHVMLERGCSFLHTDRKARIGRRRRKRILDLY